SAALYGRVSRTLPGSADCAFGPHRRVGARHAGTPEAGGAGHGRTRLRGSRDDGGPALARPFHRPERPEGAELVLHGRPEDGQHDAGRPCALLVAPGLAFAMVLPGKPGERA